MGHAIPMHFATPLQAFASTTTPCLEPDLPKFVLCLLVAVFTGGCGRMWVGSEVLGLGRVSCKGFPVQPSRARP